MKTLPPASPTVPAMETICYHGRDAKGIKLFGGMTHAKDWQAAAERAISGYSVKVSAGFRSPRWVDKDGREVSIYLSVHPEHTARGLREIAAEHARLDQEEKDGAQREREAEEKAEALADTLGNKIAELGGAEKVLALLKALPPSI